MMRASLSTATAARRSAHPISACTWFVSSTLAELADERAAVERAITSLRLTPVMFSWVRARTAPGAVPGVPRPVDIFIGLYWQRYGWIGPGMDISGLEDELRLSDPFPRLLYLKEPAPDREPRPGSSRGSSSRRDGRLPHLPLHAGAGPPGPRRPGAAAERAVRRLHRRQCRRSSRSGAPFPSLRPGCVGQRSEHPRIELSSADVRLVTLTSPGGVRKDPPRHRSCRRGSRSLPVPSRSSLEALGAGSDVIHDRRRQRVAHRGTHRLGDAFVGAWPSSPRLRARSSSSRCRHHLHARRPSRPLRPAEDPRHEFDVLRLHAGADTSSQDCPPDPSPTISLEATMPAVRLFVDQATRPAAACRQPARSGCRPRICGASTACRYATSWRQRTRLLDYPSTPRRARPFSTRSARSSSTCGTAAPRCARRVGGRRPARRCRRC